MEVSVQGVDCGVIGAVVVYVEYRTVAQFTFKVYGCDVAVRYGKWSICVCRDPSVDKYDRSNGVMSVGVSVGGVNDMPVVITPGVTVGVYPQLLYQDKVTQRGVRVQNIMVCCL